MKNSAKTNEKRTVLISLSRKARKIKEAMLQRAETERDQLYWATRTINDILFDVLYRKEENREFKTFEQWKREGKRVKKGEKAVLIWGQPVQGKAKKEKDNDPENMYEYWPICYLFSDQQVA